jgi:hypothetical protein
VIVVGNTYIFCLFLNYIHENDIKIKKILSVELIRNFFVDVVIIIFCVLSASERINLPVLSELLIVLVLLANMFGWPFWAVS